MFFSNIFPICIYISRLVDILSTAKARGFWDISEPCLQNSRSYEFSPQWTMPCPLFYAKNIRLPSRSIFIDAFLSLLCILPHLGQVQFLIFRFLVSVFRYPHSEHSWLEWKNLSISTTDAPALCALYFNLFTKSANPKSDILLPILLEKQRGSNIPAIRGIEEYFQTKVEADTFTCSCKDFIF